jgi:hypothetical protein
MSFNLIPKCQQCNRITEYICPSCSNTDPPPYQSHESYMIVGGRIYFPTTFNGQVNEHMRAKSPELNFSPGHNSCVTCLNAHQYFKIIEPLTFTVLPSNSHSFLRLTHLADYLLSTCQKYNRGKENEYPRTCFWINPFGSSQSIKNGGERAFRSISWPDLELGESIEPLKNSSIDTEVTNTLFPSNAFKTSSGAKIHQIQLRNILSSSRTQTPSSSSQLFGSWQRPNQNGTSQWHSCVILLSLKDRILLREENQLSMEGYQCLQKEHGLEFCPHYTSECISKAIREIWRRLPQPHGRWAQERSWRCQKCGTEVTLLYRNEAVEGPNVFVWRYVDLGAPMNANSAQWRAVTQSYKKPRLRRKIDDRRKLYNRPLNISGVYGPLMKLWTEKLGIVYHYDRGAIPWLSRKD